MIMLVLLIISTLITLMLFPRLFVLTLLVLFAASVFAAGLILLPA